MRRRLSRNPFLNHQADSGNPQRRTKGKTRTSYAPWFLQPYTLAQTLRSLVFVPLTFVAIYSILIQIPHLIGLGGFVLLGIVLMALVELFSLALRRRGGIVAYRTVRVIPQIIPAYINLGGPFILLIFNPFVFPERWAKWQVTLGHMRLAHLGSNTAWELELAREHMLLGLKMYTARQNAINQAATQTILAQCYLRRLRGDAEENVEQALTYCQATLDTDAYTADPVLSAMTMSIYAHAYSRRQHPDPSQNIERAIEIYRQALHLIDLALPVPYMPPPTLIKTLRPRALPVEHAHIAANLSEIYIMRVVGNPEDNFEQALSFYSDAEQVLSLHQRPFDWADITLAVAWGYTERKRGDPHENATRAVEYCRQILHVWPHKVFTNRWALVMFCLGYGYELLGKLGHTELYPQAIDAYRQALIVLTPDRFPRYCRHAAARLGWNLYAQGDFTAARQALELAHQAAQNTRRDDLRRDQAKRQLSAETVDIYACLVACCLQQNDINAAFTFAAVSKGRAFVDALASARVDLRQRDHADPELATYLAQAEDLRRQIDRLIGQLDSGSHTQLSSTGATELSRLQAQFQTLWQVISVRFPALTATQQAPVLTAEQARQLAAALAATLVEYYYHLQGWCAFVITANSIHYVDLKLLTPELLRKMSTWCQMISDCSIPTFKRFDPGIKNWVLREWYAALIEPLGIEPDVKQLLLAPFGVLHQLSLGAACRPSVGRSTSAPTTECYLADEYHLAFAPSLSALWVSYNQTVGNPDAQEQSTSTEYTAGPLLAVSYPGNDPASSDYLHYAYDEVQMIARYFPRRMELHKGQAIRDQVLAYAPGHRIIHLACHGWFDPQRPNQSGLILADGTLTVHEIITQLNLRQTRLVVMSACSSGEVNVEQGEELVGLAHAMMTAGAQTVIASLWPVDDAATAQLFKVFYQQLRAGVPQAEAMAHAARIVRATEESSHPYYWAAFQVNGLAFRQVSK